jgi:mono/diheme cytochrome c family protein
MSARITFVAVAILASAMPAYSQTASTGAGSPSPAVIARGDSVFHGPGNCYACHGSKGEGLVGPSLIDAEWIHSKGTTDEIAAQVLKGIPKEQAKSGIPMPPKGGSTISDDDVRAVAAYVHSLSQKKPGT